MPTSSTRLVHVDTLLNDVLLGSGFFSWSSVCAAGWSVMPLTDSVLETGRMRNCVSTACAMGIIIAVVAVLLIHIDRNAVVDMNPNSRLHTTHTHTHTERERERERESMHDISHPRRQHRQTHLFTTPT